MHQARTVWTGIVGLVVSAACLGGVAAPAGAAMTATNVSYTKQPLPGCVAPLPGKGGSGAASYDDPGGGYKVAWEWTVPAAITAGATARIKASVQSFTNGGASASIRMVAPAEFGVGPPGSSDQVIASVPVGAPGTDVKERSYSFTPTRAFGAGEKQSLLVGFECAGFAYEYTGTAAPSACQASTGARIAQGSNQCTTTFLREPYPGGMATLTNPTPFGAKDRKTAVTVGSSFGSLSGTTIVGEGERTRAQATGEAVAACWLIGPETLKIPPNSKARKVLDSDDFKRLWKGAESNPEVALNFCLFLVRKFGAQDAPVAGPAATGCSVRRVAIRGRIRKGKVVSLVPVKTNPPTAVRYTCKAAGGGAIKLIADGRRAGGLKKQLGKRLDLGVVRSPRAKAGARGRLTFGFGRA